MAVRALVAWAALWGVALGALAPATTALVELSGLAAPGTSLAGSTDAGFFFGFVPLLTVLVVVLLSLNHLPLRHPAAYHRELTAALLLVGLVALAGLRTHGARVTDDQWHDAWLFVHGSLVLHVLVTYWLVRLAIRHLTGVHAHHASLADDLAGPPVAPGRSFLPDHTPRYAATLGLALHGIVWGVAVATAAGAAAGTLVLPVSGTLVGAYYGAIYGLVPTGLGALAVVTAVSWRRDTDPAAVGRTVQVTLALVGAVVLAGLWPFLAAAQFRPTAWQEADVTRVWLVVVPVVVLLLRQAAPRLAATYVRLTRSAADDAT